MPRVAIVLLLTLSACSHNKMDGHYECNYETTEEAYQRCMEVTRGLRETTRSAGERE